MHPHAVFVPERLALGIDRRERQQGRVQRVNAAVREVLGSRGSAFEAEPLRQTGVAGPKDVDLPIIWMSTDLCLQRNVNVVEFAQADQFGFAHQAAQLALGTEPGGGIRADHTLRRAPRTGRGCRTVDP